MPRAPVYLALLLAIGAAFWLGQTERAGEPEDSESSDEPTSSGASTQKDPILRPQPAAPVVVGASKPSREPHGNETPISTSALEGASLWARARVRVRVIRPRGPALQYRNASVYAFPAAQTFEDDDNLAAKRWTGGDGPIDMDLPSGGTWHVGVRTDQGSDAVEVQVPEDRTIEVELRLPATGTITAIVEAGIPSELAAYGPLTFSGWSAHELGRRYPRPGEATHGLVFGKLIEGDRTELQGALHGRKYGIALQLPNKHGAALQKASRTDEFPPTFGVVRGPHIAEAGGTLRYQVFRYGRILIDCVWAGARPEAAKNKRIQVWLVQGNGRRRLGTYVPRTRDAPRNKYHTLLEACSGSLELVGAGRADLPARVEIRAGETTQLELTIHYDASRPAVKPSVSRPTGSEEQEEPEIPQSRVHVVYPATDAREEAGYSVYAFGRRHDGERGIEHDGRHFERGETESIVFDDLAVETVYVAVLPWHASRSGRAARAYRITPVPAGYLLVVPEVPVPGALGSLMVSMRDGGLLPHATIEHKGGFEIEDVKRRQPVQAGTVLGPLPAGTYDFDLWLSGAHIGRASATVVAHKLQPFTIPVPKR